MNFLSHGICVPYLKTQIQHFASPKIDVCEMWHITSEKIFNDMTKQSTHMQVYMWVYVS